MRLTTRSDFGSDPGLRDVGLQLLHQLVLDLLIALPRTEKLIVDVLIGMTSPDKCCGSLETIDKM